MLIYILDNCYLSKLIFELHILHDVLCECREHMRMHVAWIFGCLEAQRQRDRERERARRGRAVHETLAGEAHVCRVEYYELFSLTVHVTWQTIGKIVVCTENRFCSVAKHTKTTMRRKIFGVKCAGWLLCMQ